MCNSIPNEIHMVNIPKGNKGLNFMAIRYEEELVLMVCFHQMSCLHDSVSCSGKVYALNILDSACHLEVISNA